MHIHYTKTYEEMSRMAAKMFVDSLRVKPDLLLCCATGNSPTGLYREQEKLLSGEIINQFPATQLWRHENVDCLMVKNH